MLMSKHQKNVDLYNLDAKLPELILTAENAEERRIREMASSAEEAC